jgi:hypothetical protein
VKNKNQHLDQPYYNCQYAKFERLSVIDRKLQELTFEITDAARLYAQRSATEWSKV